MTGFRKRLLALSMAAVLGAGPGVPAALGQSAEQAAAQTAKVDALLAELAEPDRPDWARVEAEVLRLWSQSGSPSMDLLLRQGNAAMEAQDFPGAVEILSALVDHAPGFAEGWNARATAFFYMEEYSLALADIERTLALNPRHFAALEGLAAVMEATDRPELALRAARAAHAINPNRPTVNEAIARLERLIGSVDA